MGWPYQQKPPMGWPLDYNSGLVPDAGFWPMLESSGSKVFDLSGNGNAVIKTDLGTGYTFEWKEGGIYTIESGGNHSYLQTLSPSPNFSVGTGPYTLIAQVKPDSFLATYHMLMDFGNYNPMWYFTSAGKLEIYDGGDKGVSNGSISAGEKSTIAWVREGIGANQTKYYINGQLDSTTQHADIISASQIQIKGNLNANFILNGILYWVHFYNWALSASEIAQVTSEPFCMFKDPAEIALLGGYAVEVSVSASISASISASMKIGRAHV